MKITKIVLIGFMGSGKTTFSKLLGKALALPSYEMDEMILTDSQFSSISEIFSQKGEKYFRMLETNVAEKISTLDSGVISTGGGVVTRKDTMTHLKKNATIIYLQASFETISQRIGKDTTRPLFKDKMKARELFTKREALYLNYADLTISTNSGTKDDILKNMLERIRSL